jgi:hypothetical protein
MNERIRQLAEQAGLITPQDDRENWHEYINDVEKFAELIVRECAEIADKGWADPGHQIKQHFGVKE